MARREERAYREYVSDEQRSQPGCPARELCDESLLRGTSGEGWHGPLSVGGEEIADAADRADHGVVAVFQLLAQVADVHVDGALVGRALALVQDGRDLIARDDSSCGSHQQIEDIELDRGQRDALAVLEHFA